jgi:hypothetical protein
MTVIGELSKSRRWAPPSLLAAGVITAVGLVAAVAGRADLPDNAVTMEQVERGRLQVVSRDCGGCHSRDGNGSEPGRLHWLAGDPNGFQVGPFRTRPRNLTPDNTTGLGRFTPRQLFNALRYGLRPGETPDVVITSMTPGEGNFPEEPHYLAPPMPWPAWRYMTDQDLWDTIAYLKHGLKPVASKIKDSEGPPDFWAGEYTEEKIGPYPLLPYPMGTEEYRP